MRMCDNPKMTNATIPNCKNAKKKIRKYHIATFRDCENEKMRNCYNRNFDNARMPKCQIPKMRKCCVCVIQTRNIKQQTQTMNYQIPNNTHCGPGFVHRASNANHMAPTT